MPAQSPTLSPTLSAMVAGVRGSAAGVPGPARADEVAADVSTLGEDAAAETGEDRDQRGAEAERDQRVDDGAAVGRELHRVGKEAEIEGDAEQREARDQEAGDGARLESELE